MTIQTAIVVEGGAMRGIFSAGVLDGLLELGIADFDLAIGHLLTEAMLHSATEVSTLMHCTDLDDNGSPTFNVVDVTLAPGAVLHRPARARTETISSAASRPSGCGVTAFT